jgi:hypothetical protein
MSERRRPLAEELLSSLSSWCIVDVQAGGGLIPSSPKAGTGGLEGRR